MKKISLCLLFLFVVAELSAQTTLTPYTRAVIDRARKAPETTVATRSVDGVVYLPAFIRMKDDNLGALEAMGVEIGIVIDRIVTARIPLDSVESVGNLPSVVSIDAARKVEHMLDRADSLSHVNLIHKPTPQSGLQKSYKGKGVIVGVVDQGFWFDHPAFTGESEDDFRIKRVWDQNSNAGTSVRGYITKGSEFIDREEIVDQKTDDKQSSHGTHVASIAAGTDQVNRYAGVAPESELIFVGLDRNDRTLTNISVAEGVHYVLRHAQEEGRPAVVNLSVGSHLGPRDGTSSFDRMMERMVGEGALLVGSAGNYGRIKAHLKKEFSSTQDTLKSFVDFIMSSQAQIDIYGEKGKPYTIRVVLYDQETGRIVETTPEYLSTEWGQFYTQFKAQTIGGMAVRTGVSPDNGAGNVFIDIDLEWTPRRHWIGFIITSKESQTINAWSNADNSQFANHNKEGWMNGTNEGTVIEVCGTGKRIITVGSYNSRSEWTDLSGNLQQPFCPPEGAISDFSSKGPTADGRTKPDITAPGEAIIAAISPYYASSEKTKATDTVVTSRGTFHYGVMKGTSMSSPFVAGTMALWLEANPKLTPEEALSVLKATAVKDNFTGPIGFDGSNTWGWGKLDALAGLKEVIKRNPTSIENPQDNSTSPLCLVAQRDGTIHLFFAKTANNVEVALISMGGYPIANRSLPSIQQGESITLSDGYPGGTYLLTIFSSSGKQSQKIVITP